MDVLSTLSLAKNSFLLKDYPAMHIFAATNNSAKVARLRQLLAGTRVTIVTPDEAGVTAVEVEEGSDIIENATRKARAYFGQMRMPILGMDSAFVIPGTELDPAKVRRNALEGQDESKLTADEIAALMTAYYRQIAEAHGGQASAYWQDVFVLLLPDCTLKTEESRRHVILTPEVRGKTVPNFPLRSMYIVQATGKYATEQTAEEELVELKPYQQALRRLFDLY